MFGDLPAATEHMYGNLSTAFHKPLSDSRFRFNRSWKDVTESGSFVRDVYSIFLDDRSSRFVLQAKAQWKTMIWSSVERWDDDKFANESHLFLTRMRPITAQVAHRLRAPISSGYGLSSGRVVPAGICKSQELIQQGNLRIYRKSFNFNYFFHGEFRDPTHLPHSFCF